MMPYMETKAAPMRAVVDPELCTGCEICVIVCPEVFEMQDTTNGRVAAVHSERVLDNVRSFCKDARDCCKSGAITIEDMA